MNAIGRFFVGVHVWLFRATGGKFGGSIAGRSILLLTTTGRKTGLARTVPLVYLKGEDGVPMIAASNNGADTHPVWFRNIEANDSVTVEIGDQKIPSRARVMLPEERAPKWAAYTARYPNFAGYEKKTTRLIPLLALERNDKPR